MGFGRVGFGVFAIAGRLASWVDFWEWNREVSGKGILPVGISAGGPFLERCKALPLVRIFSFSLRCLSEISPSKTSTVALSIFDAEAKLGAEVDDLGGGGVEFESACGGWDAHVDGAVETGGFPGGIEGDF